MRDGRSTERSCCCCCHEWGRQANLHSREMSSFVVLSSGPRTVETRRRPPCCGRTSARLACLTKRSSLRPSRRRRGRHPRTDRLTLAKSGPLLLPPGLFTSALSRPSPSYPAFISCLFSASMGRLGPLCTSSPSGRPRSGPHRASVLSTPSRSSPSFGKGRHPLLRSRHRHQGACRHLLQKSR